MVGKVTSEGDRAMRSNIAREQFQLDGSGIKIGVISNSYNAQAGAAVDVANGELPGRRNPNGYKKPVRVLQDNLSFRTDEGRAMLQIVHDVAPGAELLFHSADSTEVSLANAVRSLVEAGADIIVDDLGTSNTLIFQDGAVAQAIEAATAQGVTYFSAAGNDGNRSYESAFRAGTTFTYRGNTYEAHNFDSGSGVDLFQDIQLPAASANDLLYGSQPEINLILGWDQPSGQVSNDLEFFLVGTPQLPDAGGNLIAETFIASPAAEIPLRQLEYSTTQQQTVYLMIARRVNSTSPVPGLIKWVSYFAIDDGVKYQYVNDSSSATGGSTIIGHPNSKGAIAVGAASFSTTPAYGGTTPQLEPFSSFGGTQILFDKQGNRLAAAEIRQKPEIVAPDRVSTAVTSSNLVLDFSSFPGTSAAAPHAAAVAALMLQRAGGRRSRTPAQLLTALQTTAIPMAAPGNFSSGAGFVQADGAVLDSFLVKQEGTEGNDRLRGTAVSENLYGFAGNDTLTGAAGYDALFGGTGRDRLSGGAANDYLVGDLGDDRLLGGKGNDTLVGRQGKDRLQGEVGDDRLVGGEGSDILSGGKGKNRLVGERGKDLFQLDRQGTALIQDFRDREDKLGLDRRLNFSNLEITQRGRNALVQFRGSTLAELQRLNANTITGADFVI
ncbi:S8 family serine peptidase [Phormidium tenue FACHB-886]|nr:S8 family serine peptidase [Phormidium tenue FACHB-886]